jgi:hypothetical protein
MRQQPPLHPGMVAFASRIDGVDAGIVSDGLTIVRLHRQIEMLIEEQMAGWGLTARQINILRALYFSSEGLTPAELSDEVGLSRSLR